MGGRYGGDPRKRRKQSTPYEVSHRLFLAFHQIGKNANPGPALPILGAIIRGKGSADKEKASSQPV